MTPYHPFLLLLLPYAASALTKGTLVIERSVDAALITSEIDNLTPACSFDGEIVVSHPMSMNENDRFFSIGQLQMNAIEMMTDYVNLYRCGVQVLDKRYSVKLRTYGDDSDESKVEAIANYTVIDSNFLLGPYSSTLAKVEAKVAQDNNKVMIAGGAAATSVFEERDAVFGTFPPTAKYLSQAVKGLKEQGAQSIATVSEDAPFTEGVCGAVPDLAAQYSMVVTSTHTVAKEPTKLEFAPVVDQFVAENPDVVVTCVYSEGCKEWIKSMRDKNWSPKAQVFTVCVGTSNFLNEVGSDVMYMMGVSPWDKSLPINDTITGWSAFEFSNIFLKYSKVEASYHAASAAASLAILVDAIERAESIDETIIKDVLASFTFKTLYGEVSFDSNGQSNNPSLLLQYDENEDVHVVYPEESKSGVLNYPMPTWGYRDCIKGNLCVDNGGNCEQTGLCACAEGKIVYGSGLTASCVEVPDEDMSYLDNALLAVGYTAVGIQFFASLGAILWTYCFRHNALVKASQPIFMYAIAVGCFIMSSAILPLSVEGGYRYKIDPDTYELTDEKDPDIEVVDASCMAFVWLYNIGFTIIYSALFAKILRIKKLFSNLRIRRTTVLARDVARIMLVLCFLMIFILTLFHLVSPLRWEREVQHFDENNFREESVGSCTLNDNSDIFLLLLVCFHALCLLYAVALCFQVWNVPDQFAESKWIMGSIFCLGQLMIVTLPIVFLVRNNANAFFFVRVGIAFLEAFLVTILIFGPKVHAVYVGMGKSQLKNAIGNYVKSTDSKSEKPISANQGAENDV